MSTDGLASRISAEHRALDECLGRLISAAWSGNTADARAAAEEFDGKLRRHTREEEDVLLPPPSGHGLAPAEGESEGERLTRELRVEHVQLRELSGILTRRLSTGSVSDEVRGLVSNLARRWDAHTQREERELLSQIEN
jgi:Hemerythrin HHE cation binding domain